MYKKDNTLDTSGDYSCNECKADLTFQSQSMKSSVVTE